MTANMTSTSDFVISTLSKMHEQSDTHTNVPVSVTGSNPMAGHDLESYINPEELAKFNAALQYRHKQNRTLLPRVEDTGLLVGDAVEDAGATLAVAATVAALPAEAPMAVAAGAVYEPVKVGSKTVTAASKALAEIQGNWTHYTNPAA